jgi:phage transcriptional regulator, ArpU family
MGLLPRVDEKATQNNVKEYLKKEFPRLVVQAGYSMLEVQSPSFGGIGSKGNNVRNGIEDKIVDHFNAKPTVIATIRAIDHCPEKSSSILRKLYICGMTDAEVERSSSYSHSTYQNKKKDAWLWFADAFQSTRDFHVYEEVSWKQYT